ncbi:phosphatase PAP2 family protein [Streptomyces sp. NPDC046557]|uniref:phosphatase PAP2 family protein n=1 Tax=Streptomyces sp. NPDC046557 TaxID=3155372 RepID=UPI0033FBA561
MYRVARPAVARTGAVLPVCWAAAVGLSRIYLGVYWPSDVLGGWLYAPDLARGRPRPARVDRPAEGPVSPAGTLRRPSSEVRAPLGRSIRRPCLTCPSQGSSEHLPARPARHRDETWTRSVDRGDGAR